MATVFEYQAASWLDMLELRGAKHRFVRTLIDGEHEWRVLQGDNNDAVSGDLAVDVSKRNGSVKTVRHGRQNGAAYGKHRYERIRATATLSQARLSP